MPDPSLPLDPRAEELFRDYLARLDVGEIIDFESICRANPPLERDLRQLKSAVEIVDRVRPATPQTSLSERLKVLLGADPIATLSLDDEPRPDSGLSSRLFERLRGAGTRGARYKLLGEVARGGMGAILKIWDDELRRTLAMKVVLDQGTKSGQETPEVDPQTLGRFLEEAQVTGQLDHPGIVPVHELGLGADGRVYFTMRLVKGVDLRTIFEHVRSGKDGWSQVRALGVMLTVCEAMSYAHSKKVIHRDLKPANVMVGKFGEVYVMDWGLARVLGREDRHDLRLQPQIVSTPSVVNTERHEQRDNTPDSPLVTMDGDIVGTPSFMPPEQARGELQRVGQHSDVYSVGAMLYQLIGGEMPYVPAGARVSARTILGSVLRGPPRPLHELAPTASAELIAIVERAMARDISDRYPTMQGLADDLRAYVEGRVVAAYETGAWAEARKWIQRNKPLATSLAAVVLALIAGIAMTTREARRADAKTVEARRNLESERRQRERAERELLFGVVMNLLIQHSMPAATKPEILDQLVRSADDVVARVRSGDISQLGPALWIQAGRHRVDFASREGGTVDRHVFLPPETTEEVGPLTSVLALGLIHKFAGRHAESQPYYDSGIALMREKMPDGHWMLSPFLVGSGGSHLSRGEFEVAAKEAEEGYSIARGYFGPGNQITTNAAWGLVRIYDGWGKPDLAAKWRRILNEDEVQSQDGRTSAAPASRGEDPR